MHTCFSHATTLRAPFQPPYCGPYTVTMMTELSPFQIDGKDVRVYIDRLKPSFIFSEETPNRCALPIIGPELSPTRQPAPCITSVGHWVGFTNFLQPGSLLFAWGGCVATASASVFLKRSTRDELNVEPADSGPNTMRQQSVRREPCSCASARSGIPLPDHQVHTMQRKNCYNMLRVQAIKLCFPTEAMTVQSKALLQ